MAIIIVVYFEGNIHKAFSQFGDFWSQGDSEVWEVDGYIQKEEQLVPREQQEMKHWIYKGSYYIGLHSRAE